AFRNMKTVSLEMRPVHHKTDQRIRAHVFLCMLAYHLQWHLKQRLAPLFAAQAASLAGKTIQAKDRDLTLENIIETLKSQRRDQVSAGGAVFQQITEPTPEIREILNHLATAPNQAP